VARQSDITGIIAFDKLAVVLPHCSSQQAKVAADRILQELRKPVLLENMPSYQSSISIGLASCTDNNADFNQLVRHASIAMQYADNDPRRGIRVFEAYMTHAVQERLHLENDLRDALRKDQLHM